MYSVIYFTSLVCVFTPFNLESCRDSFSAPPYGSQIWYRPRLPLIPFLSTVQDWSSAAFILFWKSARG